MTIGFYFVRKEVHYGAQRYAGRHLQDFDVPIRMPESREDSAMVGLAIQF